MNAVNPEESSRPNGTACLEDRSRERYVLTFHVVLEE